MVANSATAQDSLLSVQGAGWEFCTVPMLPVNLGGSIAGIATIGDDELGETPVIKVTMDYVDGNAPDFAASMIISGIRPTTVKGVPVRIPFAVQFVFPATKPGVVKVTAAGEHDKELAAVTFAIRDPVPDAPPPS